MIRFALVLIVAGVAASPLAAQVTLENGPARTHLIELYTSEGCSSCPPAEAWLSKLKDEPRLWRDFVPVAFHVDYWDRLGWRDPLASKRWTARQYEYAALWKSGSVYTPGFVLNGHEWRDRRIPERSKEETGILRIAVDRERNVNATFAPTRPGDHSHQVHVAKLGCNLNINVKAGENSGRRLLHDFVVLSLTTEALDGGAKVLRLPANTARRSGDLREAIAAWVTETGRMEPIQAVGGWLD